VSSYGGCKKECNFSLSKCMKGKWEKKNHEKKKEEKKSKINIILSHVNHTFLILNPRIGPQALRHTHYTIGKNVFLNVKKGSINISICFKLVPRLLVPGPFSQVALRLLMLIRLTMHNEFIKVQSVFSR
jgi:hypothetical protein